MDKLGFGLMRLPCVKEGDRSQVDISTLSKMVDMFLNAGFTYFDTAYMYHNYTSESAIGEALVKRHKRDSFTLATKLHVSFVKKPEDRDAVFFDQLKKTCTEYFDYYLLHGIYAGSVQAYEKFDCFNWLKEKKAEGLVKHIGFSFHGDSGLLERLLNDYPWVEFVQLQLNYLDWDSPAIESRKCYEACVRHNKQVMVMEPVKGGTLAFVPQKVEELFKKHHPDLSPASWAIRFACSLPNVKTVLSGMSSIEQMSDNISTVKNTGPLNEEELAVIDEAVRIFKEGAEFIPCTGCSYCAPGCPQNIPIPTYFSLYNAEKQENGVEGWKPQKTYYYNIARTKGRAGDCIGCGQCEEMCPQHLPVIEYMKKVSLMMERRR